MKRTLLTVALVVFSACAPDEPFEPDGMRCETSLDCPRSMCSMGNCHEGFCVWSGIGCGDGGVDPSACASTDECPLDACGRQTFCVAGYCGELQRPCPSSSP
jgi:hypothetical protein